MQILIRPNGSGIFGSYHLPIMSEDRPEEDQSYGKLVPTKNFDGTQKDFWVGQVTNSFNIMKSS